MASLYKKYIRLLSKWPVDTAKGNQDLGLHIREQIKVAFSKGELQNPSDQRRCQMQYESLERLALNRYGDKYKHNLTIASAGVKLEECRLLLTPEAMQYLNEQKGFFRKIQNTFIAYFYARK